VRKVIKEAVKVVHAVFSAYAVAPLSVGARAKPSLRGLAGVDVFELYLVAGSSLPSELQARIPNPSYLPSTFKPR
jgi:hypothetical protein